MASTNGSAISIPECGRRARGARLPWPERSRLQSTIWPRGVLHTWATNVDDPTTDPKFGRVGRQKSEDTGPLTRKRMKTLDAEVLDETLKWIDKNGKGGKPFFVWFNSTATTCGLIPILNTCRWRSTKEVPRRMSCVRVPCMLQWPGHVLAGRISNGIQNHEDRFVTLAAAAGPPNLEDDLLKDYKMGNTTFRVPTTTSISGPARATSLSGARFSTMTRLT